MPISTESQQALNRMYPLFYTDLKFIGNPRLENKIVSGITEAVGMGEQSFNQIFDGWYPSSAAFGVNPLRPHHLYVAASGSATAAASGLGIGYSAIGTTGRSNRWQWTSGTNTSVAWSGAEYLVANFSLDINEIILLYGYFNLSPVQNTIEIQIKPGNVTLPVMQLQPMRMKNEQYILFPEPIIVSPRSPLQVDASCISISTSEEAGFLGYFFAPCSYLITKR